MNNKKQDKKPLFAEVNLTGATSRLDRTERALDLERATREDIIRAEVERRMAEAEKRIREEVKSLQMVKPSAGLKVIDQ